MKKEKRRSRGPGWLYAIGNAVWPGYTKLGRTFDLSERLRAYQIASPRRDYHLLHSAHFEDVLLAERRLKLKTTGFPGKGEWCLLHPDDAVRIIEDVRKELNDTATK